MEDPAGKIGSNPRESLKGAARVFPSKNTFECAQ